jgi:hypothetical protein
VAVELGHFLLDDMAGRRKRTPRLPFGVETPPVVNGRVNTRTARATGVVRDAGVPDPIPGHGSNSNAETGRMDQFMELLERQQRTQKEDRMCTNQQPVKYFFSLSQSNKEFLSFTDNLFC